MYTIACMIDLILIIGLIIVSSLYWYEKDGEDITD